MNLRFYHIITIIVIAFTVISCSVFERKHVDNALVEVHGNKLFISEVQANIPSGISAEDSSKIADRYIKQWITNCLMYEDAQSSISNTAAIDKMVEAYRRSLILHQYEEELLEQSFNAYASEEELQSFYEKFGSELILNENLIKGLFLVVAKEAPKLQEVKEWMRSSDTLSLEKIEKYVIENIASYDFFLDEWFKFNDIVRYYPEQISDQERFLQKTSFAEHTDSTKTYLWYIKDYKLTGDVKPYEYARPEIEKMLSSKRQIEFIQQFKQELYEEALQTKEVIFQ